jgi:hypothetical protein
MSRESLSFIPNKHIALEATCSGDRPGPNPGGMAGYHPHISKEPNMEPFTNTRLGAWALLVIPHGKGSFQKWAALIGRPVLPFLQSTTS